MNKKNLVVLSYASNNCYTNVVDLEHVEESGLEVNVKKGTWSYRKWKNNPIGEMRNLSSPESGSDEIRWGVIGVYDKTNTKQLDMMIHDAKEATESTICYD